MSEKETKPTSSDGCEKSICPTKDQREAHGLFEGEGGEIDSYGFLQR